MDEARLIDKLRLIETLFSGATTEGEKVAAERARGRILERLKRSEQEDPPVEYQFSMADQEPWKMPLRKYIEHLYFKRFGKEHPDSREGDAHGATAWAASMS